MNNNDFNTGLLDFIQQSPTPFHAVQNMVNTLENAGFQRLDEQAAWFVQEKQVEGRYFVTRNDSSIIAFDIKEPLQEQGIRMVGAHTDSPCLKVKPNPELVRQGYLQLGVEVYGGVLLNPWFDRDLSLAGRVSYEDESGDITHQLVNWKKAIAVIPSLAIHLDREANDKRSINKQQHLPPVLMRVSDDNTSLNDLLLELLKAQSIKATSILNYELSFYDVQTPAIVGLNDDFIASARLDNLLSCYTGLMVSISIQF